MRNPDVCHTTLQMGSIFIDGLDSLSGHEAIGEPFRYEVRASMELPLPLPSQLLGAAATLTLQDAFGQRTISGIAAEVETTITDKGKGEISAVIVPRTHALTLGRTSRSFQDKSPMEVITSIVSPVSPISLSLSRQYPKVPYRVQREEDDWSFVTRTLNAEGVTYHYDHDEGSAFVVTDDTRGAPSIAGAAVFPYHPDGLRESSEAIVSLARRSSASTTKISRKSFSWKNPNLGLSKSAGQGRYEAYDAAGGGPASPDVLERQARDAETSIAAKASGIKGEATTLRLYPGKSFAITADGLDEPWFAEEWTVTSIDIQLAGSQRAFTTKFEALAKRVPFRPPAPSGKVEKRDGMAPAKGQQSGLSWGVVIADAGDEVFPDESGRVRVQMLWDREGSRTASAGTWMRVAQRCAPGSMMFPRTGWHVATLHEEGSVDAPNVLSRIHDGERPPEYSLPAHKTRVVYKTATTPGGGSHNELHFEDAKGRENVYWNASRDMDILTKNDAGERIENDAWHDVGVNQTIQSGESHTEKVGMDQTVTIGANQQTTVAGDRGKTVGGNETVTIGGSRKLDVGESHALGVTGNRTVNIGAAQIDISLGQIATTTQISRVTVGGAILRIGAKNFTEDAAILSTELVGAAKVEMAGVNRTLGVEKDFIEAVGGAVNIKAGKRFIDSATKTASWMIGGIMTGSAKEVTVEGYSSVELRCGDSVVILEPEQIRVEAKTLKLDGAELEALTGIIVHNG